MFLFIVRYISVFAIGQNRNSLHKLAISFTSSRWEQTLCLRSSLVDDYLPLLLPNLLDCPHLPQLLAMIKGKWNRRRTDLNPAASAPAVLWRAPVCPCVVSVCMCMWAQIERAGGGTSLSPSISSPQKKITFSARFRRFASRAFLFARSTCRSCRRSHSCNRNRAERE